LGAQSIVAVLSVGKTLKTGNTAFAYNLREARKSRKNTALSAAKTGRVRRIFPFAQIIRSFLPTVLHEFLQLIRHRTRARNGVPR
jgi:hypothetical protein